MGKFYLVIACLLAISACAFSSEDSDVLTLTAANFDQTLSENPIVFVEFYAPWCGHCKHLAPEWEKAATTLKEKGIAVKLAKVDADTAENTELRNRFEIRGFPTLKLFREGSVSDYQGERSADAIVSYMKKQASPASTTLANVADAQKFRDEEDVVIIGFFDNVESPEYAAFKKVSSQLRDDFTFGEVIGASDVAKALEVETTPAVVLFKKFDEKRNVYAQDATDEALLSTFIKSNSVPLIDEIGPHNFKKYVESGVPLAYVFVDLSKEGQREENVAHIQELAEATKGQVNWVLIDWSKYAKHSERLGLSGNTVPSIAIEKLADGTHFVFDESTALSKDGITSWVNDFIAGKIQPTIKSEPIPEDNNGPVKVVVANNFEEIVNDKTKDVLVEFYAPWCGHCKKLTPIYEELGADLQATHKDVVIAKIDATANDISPKFGVRGFPTLKFFPANNKDTPIDYEGDRSLSDMKDFVLRNIATSASAAAGEQRDEL